MRKAIGYNFLDAVHESRRALDPWYKQGYTIIAIDGMHKTPLPPHLWYKRMPKYSTDGSEELLKQRYGDKLVYEKLYASQREKRQRYLDIAGELKMDLLIVFDSDDYIHPDYQDWQWFNLQLEKIVATPVKTEIGYVWFWIPDDDIWAKQYNAVPSNSWQKYMRIHKNPGEQQYVLSHWQFTTKEMLRKVSEVDIDMHPYIASRGGDMSPTERYHNPYLITPMSVVDGVRFTTDRLYRSKEQLNFGHGWAFQETWEDDCRHYDNCRNLIMNLKPLNLSRPHYYNEQGRLIWYNKWQRLKHYLLTQFPRAL